ncbi:MAG: 3-hydroxyacyl-ACP dehydratase FabZ [Betaproteobacteria bacterium]
MTLSLAALEALVRSLPHRYPSLLIDRIDAVTPGKEARGMKCVTMNEPCFQGHFPDYPVLPGVLVLEALVQLSILLAHSTDVDLPTDVQGVDGARFKRQVVPGDLLRLETRATAPTIYMVQAWVGDELAAEAKITLGTPGAGSIKS